MQELQIINEILSAKPNNQTLSSFNKYLNNFYDITKKIAVENERDLEYLLYRYPRIQSK